MSAIVTLLLVFCMRCISVQAVENGVTNSPSSNDIDDSTTSKTNNSNRYHVVTVNFPYVAVPYVICLWILLASVAKIGELNLYEWLLLFSSRNIHFYEWLFLFINRNIHFFSNYFHENITLHDLHRGMDTCVTFVCVNLVMV